MCKCCNKMRACGCVQTPPPPPPPPGRQAGKKKKKKNRVSFSFSQLLSHTCWVDSRNLDLELKFEKNVLHVSLPKAVSWGKKQ